MAGYASIALNWQAPSYTGDSALIAPQLSTSTCSLTVHACCVKQLAMLLNNEGLGEACTSSSKAVRTTSSSKAVRTGAH